MAAKLEQNKEVAYLSYQLATIKTDVELELTCEQLEVQQPAAEELLGLFKSMSSNAGLLMSKRANGYRLKGRNPQPPQETSVADEAPEVTATVISYDNYVTILDEETLKAWIAKLEKRRYLHLIPKPTASITSLPTLVGLSFAIERA